MNNKFTLKSNFLKLFPFKLIEKIIRKRTNWIVNNLIGFLKEGERIIDIGAGGGWVAKEIQRKRKVQILLLDVIDFNQTDLEIVLYDGKKMPFSDETFDTALLIFVLHHCKNPLEVLKEAKRVTKDKIIIMEDIYSNIFEKFLIYVSEILGFLGSFFIRPPGESLPFSFKSFSEWERIIKNLGLKIIEKKKLLSPFKTTHCLFVAKKC